MLAPWSQAQAGSANIFICISSRADLEALLRNWPGNATCPRVVEPGPTSSVNTSSVSVTEIREPALASEVSAVEQHSVQTAFDFARSCDNPPMTDNNEELSLQRVQIDSPPYRWQDNGVGDSWSPPRSLSPDLFNDESEDLGRAMAESLRDSYPKPLSPTHLSQKARHTREPDAGASNVASSSASRSRSPTFDTIFSDTASIFPSRKGTSFSQNMDSSASTSRGPSGYRPRSPGTDSLFSFSQRRTTSSAMDCDASFRRPTFRSRETGPTAFGQRQSVPQRSMAEENSDPFWEMEASNVTQRSPSPDTVWEEEAVSKRPTSPSRRRPPFLNEARPFSPALSDEFEDEPKKRGGRARVPSPALSDELDEEPKMRRARGPPPAQTEDCEDAPKKKRGRPKGSKNKPKYDEGAQPKKQKKEKAGSECNICYEGGKLVAICTMQLAWIFT
ncbi:hypothetical protein ONE63_011348 [Megalurothrips usitatus]|uniref:Uncharacterized protein n=1 Tax=Megalurothrips usitatus TaxID=439358 RepID=A0AAV7X398_9NEOP|nr:hypothetical protein ONE63_011348 [Megalurothrips usitatus]